MITKTYRSTYFLFITVILVWGFNWPMNKIGMDYMPAIWHAALRVLFGSICAFLLALSLGKLTLPRKQDLPLIFILGTLQMGLFSLLINLGLNYVGAGRSAILVYTVPLWVTPIALLWFKEKMNKLKCFGLVLGLVGILILMAPWRAAWTADALFGDSFLLLAALTMAITICCARNMPWRLTPLELLPWQLLAAALPIGLLAWFIYPEPNISWDLIAVSAMAYTAIFATAVGYLCFALVTRAMPSITVSLGLLGVPLTGVLSAALVLGEEVTVSMKIAMLFIFSGLACVALSAKKRSALATGDSAQRA